MRSCEPTIAGAAAAGQAMATGSLHNHEHGTAHLRSASSHGHVPYQFQIGAFTLPRRKRVSRHAILLPAPRGTRYLPGRGLAAAPGTFHSQAHGSNRRLDITLAHEPLKQFARDAAVPHNSRPSFAAFAGTQDSEARHGRVPETPRAFHRKEGELPNVCG